MTSDAGFLVDCCGRKETIVINDVVFLVGAIVLSTARGYSTLVRSAGDLSYTTLGTVTLLSNEKYYICLKLSGDLYLLINYKGLYTSASL